MGLSLRSITKKIGDVAQGVERQVNPFDNGVAYSNPVSTAPPPPSFIRQAPQMGLSFIRPVVGAGADVTNFIGNAEMKAGNALGFHGFGLGGITYNGPQSNVQQFGPTVGNFVGPNTPRNFASNLGQTAITVSPEVFARPLEALASPLTHGAAQLGNKVAGRVGKRLAFAITHGLAGGASIGGAASLTQSIGGDQPITAKDVALNFVKGAGHGATQGAVFGVARGKGIKTPSPDIALGGPVGDIARTLTRAATAPRIRAALADETPKVSLKQDLTPQEQKIGTALGMSKKEILATRDQNDLAGAFKTRVSKMSPEELANLKPSEQMATAELMSKGPTKLAPVEVNAKRNPFKSLIKPVEQGDYLSARTMPQLASEPVKTSGAVWKNAMLNLKKTNPDEFKNFWRNVESLPDNASAQLKKAVQVWRDSSNRVHANSLAIGKNTNYLHDWALHPWLLKDATEEQIASGGPGILGQHAMNRKHLTIAEGEKAGLKLGDDPVNEGMKYFRGSANALHRKAAEKALIEADAGEMVKPRTRDLGYGTLVPLSEKGYKASRGLAYHQASTNRVVKGVRTVNVGSKSTLLSGGQFHQINTLFRAGSALTLKGHPVAALKGSVGIVRPLLPGGKGAVNAMREKALTDGMVDKAAKIGMPYGQEVYNAKGSFLKAGVGHEMLGRQMSMMHDQVVRSVIHDLEKKGISLDSAAAKKTGLIGNNIMTLMNKEAQNIPPVVSQGMSDWLLAGQFTPSKFRVLSKVTSKGLEGSYARAAIAGNVLSMGALIVGLGAVFHQKSDNVRDMFLRALINPAAPSLQKDSKGNTINYRLPGTDTSDVAKLLGITLTRQQSGHLGINWNPHNIPSGVEDFLRARLSPLASAGVKIKTNTTFAGKPLFDPNAPAGQKAEQAGTSIVTGMLPIGAQGLPMVKGVEKHLPGSVQEVLNAQKPGSNPLVKSVGSSFGLTPSTDTTVGKGLQSKQYFDAISQHGRGLDQQAKNAYDLWAASKKNPVTGKYDVTPNINDASNKASALLDNPTALQHMIALNRQLNSEGQKADPLWLQSSQNIKKYLQYQRMAPGGPDRARWMNQNKGWYLPLLDARNQFFSSLPPGDPNKPKLDLQYPAASSQVQALETRYNGLKDGTAKSNFINAHPELIQQWNKQSDYTNKYRQELGYSPLKKYPEATPQIQSFIDRYTASDKGMRKAIRASNPAGYQNMISYFDSVNLYNIGKQAAVSQLQGEPNYTSKEAKAISSLGSDVYQKPDGTYAIVPAGWMQGLSSSGTGSTSYSSNYASSKARYKEARYLSNSAKFRIKGSKGRIKGNKISLKRGTKSGKFKVTTANAAKTAVKLKPSEV